MKTTKALYILTILILAQVGWANLYLPLPTSLEEQIADAALIVKGRFGKILNQKNFYGYDIETGEDSDPVELAKERNISMESMARAGIPLVEYEIVVDEVLFGEVRGQVVFRTIHGDPYSDLEEKQSMDRLFILGLNPDNKTYGARNFTAILNNIEGEYRYEIFDEQLRQPIMAKLPYVSEEDLKVEVFEGLLQRAIDAKAYD